MVRRKLKDYSKNKLTLGRSPNATLITSGNYFGVQCIEMKVGTEVEYTNESLRDFINEHFPLISIVHFIGDDPMLFSEQLWSFIKYYKRNSMTKKKWHMTTSGKKYVPKFLYELYDILINIKTPATGEETPPEFIDWCGEDTFIKEKIQFLFMIAPNAEDISYAKYEIPKIGSYRKTITLQPNYEWESYTEFISMFLNMTKYPMVKILPNIEKVALTCNVII